MTSDARVRGTYMSEIKAGKFHISFSEISENLDSSDDSYFDDVIDFDDEFNKTILAEIEDGEKVKRIKLVVPYHTPGDFAVPMGDMVFLMLNDILCIFDPETCNIVKEKQIDPLGTMDAAYAYGDDFILHGEIEIYRIDRDLETKWKFFGEDIFERISGKPAFVMKEDRICLYDFNEKYYEIDYDGNRIV